MQNQNKIAYTEKKSYSFKPHTLKKLQELKVYAYANGKYNEILDEAITLLYNQKMDK